MLYLRGMSHSHGYFITSDAENSGLWVYEVERLFFRSTWPAYIPSFYGSEPPMSNRIIQTLIWVLTSFVPPIHNQGVSLAFLQGLALWRVFLPTTGSFFVFVLLTCTSQQRCFQRTFFCRAILSVLPQSGHFYSYDLLVDPHRSWEQLSRASPHKRCFAPLTTALSHDILLQRSSLH